MRFGHILIVSAAILVLTRAETNATPNNSGSIGAVAGDVVTTKNSSGDGILSLLSTMTATTTRKPLMEVLHQLEDGIKAPALTTSNSSTVVQEESSKFDIFLLGLSALAAQHGRAAAADHAAPSEELFPEGNMRHNWRLFYYNTRPYQYISGIIGVTIMHLVLIRQGYSYISEIITRLFFRKHHRIPV